MTMLKIKIFCQTVVSTIEVSSVTVRFSGYRKLIPKVLGKDFFCNIALFASIIRYRINQYIQSINTVSAYYLKNTVSIIVLSSSLGLGSMKHISYKYHNEIKGLIVHKQV